MANLVLNATFKRYDAVGGGFDVIHFATVAGQVAESATRKWLTSDQQTNLNTYLNPAQFNMANKLLKLGADGKIPANLINADFADYLKRDGSTPMLGDLNIDENGIINVGSIEWSQGGEISNVDGGDFTIILPNSLGYYIFDNKGLDLSNKRIINIDNAIDATDAPNWGQVQALVAEGISKRVDPVKATNFTLLASNPSGFLTIDGYVTQEGDRILLKGHPAPNTSRNGIWIVQAGAWEKIDDESVPGVLVFVETGTNYNDWMFYSYKHNPTGVTMWSPFARVDTITASTGLTKIGTDIRVANLGITNAMLAGSINISKLLAFTSTDTATGWGAITNANEEYTLALKINDIYSAIKLLRGTTNYNTNNNETIKTAHEVANTKNRTFLGTVATPTPPPGDTFKDGDIYIQYVA